MNCIKVVGPSNLLKKSKIGLIPLENKPVVALHFLFNLE